MGITDAIQEYMMKERPHLRAGTNIHHKMTSMGLLKAPYLEKTRRMYATLASRFFYTLARFSEDGALLAAVGNPEEKVVEKAVIEMVLQYVLTANDKSGKFMMAVFISLMQKDDTFASSARRAKILDGINYFLKLGIADYVKENDEELEMFNQLEDTNYAGFEAYREIHHKFNMTLPAFQTRVDDEDYRTIIVDSVKFKLLDLSKLVRFLVEDYNKKAMCLLPRSTMDVDSLYKEFKRHASDRVDCTSAGYSVFFSIPQLASIANNTIMQYQREMGERWGDEKIMIEEYRKLCSMNLNLLVCMMITCGSPYRVTEILTLAFANSGLMKRTMYYCNGTFELKIHYNKNTHTSMQYTNHTKMIPVCVSKMLVHYITVVRSLEYAITEKHDFETSRAKESFTRTTRGPEEKEKERILKSDKLKTFVFMNEYGARNGAQVHKYMEHVSEKHVGVKYTPRYLRQALVFFTRMFLTERRNQSMEMLQHIDVAAGHRGTTADAHYGVTRNSLYFQSAAKNHLDLEISRQWHRLLEVDQEGEVWEKPLVEDNRETLRRLFLGIEFGKAVSDEVGVRLYGRAEFRSLNQQHTVTDAMRSTKDLLVVSPTGSGKSNAYKMPVLMEKQFDLPFVTFVLTPFISLLEDVKVKMAELEELVVEVYDAEKEYEFYLKCDVIVIQLEKVKEAQGLVQFFESPTVFKYIRRLVVDEAHVLLKHREFRLSVFKVGDVFGPQVPKLFLSATFPSRMEGSLRTQFGISQDGLAVHRESTIKKNIEHVVVQGEIVVSAALREIYETEIRNRGTRGIVFVYLRNLAEELGERLGWMVFHGNLDVEEKGRVYREFAAQEGAMVVATSAFSHGVDVSKVGHVITVGGVDNVIDFQQVVGRMWRAEDSKVGRSYILCDYGFRESQITPGKCVNGVLAASLDEINGASCESLGCVKCSVCDSSKQVKAEMFLPGAQDQVPRRRAAEDEQENMAAAPRGMSREMRAWMAGHEFNVLRMYGMRPAVEDVAMALGCYSDVPLVTLINPGIIEGEDICRGCFLSQEHACSFDEMHAKVFTPVRCSLAALFEGAVIGELWQRDGMQSWLEEAAVSGNISNMMRRWYVNMVLDAKEGIGKQMYEDMMLGSWRRSVVMKVSSNSVEKISNFIREPIIGSEELVYGAKGGSSQMNKIAFDMLVKSSWNRMRMVNGDKATGYCARCWDQGNHRERKECNRDYVVQILVHAYNERSMLAEYLHERGIVKKGTVCHFIDLMVSLEDGEPMFFDLINFLMLRYILNSRRA